MAFSTLKSSVDSTPKYGKRLARFCPLSFPALPSTSSLFKIYIKDVKSSNGTFINGERLSAEGAESEPFELKTSDIVVCRHPPSHYPPFSFPLNRNSVSTSSAKITRP